MIRAAGKPPAQEFIIEEMTDPLEIAHSREVSHRANLNMDWLQSHWGDLLPQALGKHVAVAGQEAFIADTVEEALTQARRTHPDDCGLIVHFLNPAEGPRIYANRG